jgi:hypothetical protein
VKRGINGDAGFRQECIGVSAKQARQAPGCRGNKRGDAMKKSVGILVVLVMLLSLASTAVPVSAAGTVTVTPSTPNGWFFYDDGYPGGVGTFETGPSGQPAGSGSARMVLSGTSRLTISTSAYAGTRFDKFVKLEYFTYGSVSTLQFDLDVDLTDLNTGWVGRLVYIPSVGEVTGGWTKWSPMSPTAMWYTTGGTTCTDSAPCSWAAFKAAYPNAGIRAGSGLVHLKAGGPAPGFDGNVDKLTIGVVGDETIYDFDPGAGGAALVFMPDSARFGPPPGVTVVVVNLNNVQNLYGYQFKVSYNDTMVDAEAWFGDSLTNGNGVARPVYLPPQRFFDTSSSASIPNAVGESWYSACSGGFCKFAVTKMAGTDVNPVSGSGLLAYIVLISHTPGTFNLAFGDDNLSTINGASIAHSTGTSAITVFGTASVNGTVNLQGRATPIDSGTVTLTDQGSGFPPLTVTFSASDGTFSFTNVPALAGGSTYKVSAAHSMYLTSETTVLVTPGGTFSPSPTATTLKGGDANSSGLSLGKIDILDLTTIGAAFGTVPTDLLFDMNADINHDHVVNILDLVLAGGNYNLSSPQTW